MSKCLCVPRELLLFANGSQNTVKGKRSPFSQTDDGCLNFCMQIQFWVIRWNKSMHLKCFSFFRWQDRYRVCFACVVSGFAEILARGHVASFSLQRQKWLKITLIIFLRWLRRWFEGTQERLHKKLTEWYGKLCSESQQKGNCIFSLCSFKFTLSFLFALPKPC